MVKNSGKIATMIPESHLTTPEERFSHTFQEAENITTGGGWDARKYFLSELRSWRNVWRQELGPTVLQVAKISYLSAQRFLEHASEDILRNPRFDAEKYGTTTASIYRTLGRTVGDDYTRSYPYVVEGSGFVEEKGFQGLTPEQFEKFILESARDGGKIFAKWMAVAAPNIVPGGNFKEFKEAALAIRKKGGTKLVKPFAQNARNLALARRQEVFSQDFEQLTIEAIDKLGKDATYWLLRVLPTLVTKHKVNPFDFVHDMEDMAENYGQRTVKQYLGGLCKNLKTLGEIQGEEAQERLDAARKAHQELIDTCGKTASTFFAFRGLDLSSVASLQINQRSIAVLKRRAKPKVFHATAWFGSKIETLELTTLLRLVTTYAEKQGVEQAVKELQYAAAAIRNGCFVAGFPIPHLTRYNYGQNGFDEDVRGEWEYDVSGIENEVNLEEEFLEHGKDDLSVDDQERTQDEFEFDTGVIDDDGFPNEEKLDNSFGTDTLLLEGHQYRLPDFRSK